MANTCQILEDDCSSELSEPYDQIFKYEDQKLQVSTSKINFSKKICFKCSYEDDVILENTFYVSVGCETSGFLPAAEYQSYQNGTVTFDSGVHHAFILPVIEHDT
jgi:hypothetical protein